MQSLARFYGPPGPCEFLPDRVQRMQYDVVRELSPTEYTERMMRGWRRFGHAMFINACPSCSMCRSLRVPVATFRADRSQVRAWKANRGHLRLVVGTPSLSATKQALFEKFQRHQHETKGWSESSGQETLSFVDNPFRTEEWCYYLSDRLVGVGYVDDLPDALSAMYFFHDPDERRRSLGTFNVLSIIAAARERQRSYAYLGYYVEGCRSLEYKARFRPNEVLASTGAWVPFRS